MCAQFQPIKFLLNPPVSVIAYAATVAQRIDRCSGTTHDLLPKRVIGHEGRRFRGSLPRQRSPVLLTQTPELSGPRGAASRRMVEGSPVGRAGTADEIAALAALIIGPEGGFITGSDFLIDGGVTASYFYGPLAPGATVKT